jgi:hypothetical protein
LLPKAKKSYNYKMTSYKTTEAQRRATRKYKERNQDLVRNKAMTRYADNKIQINANLRAKRAEARMLKGLFPTKMTSEQARIRKRFMRARKRVPILAAKVARTRFKL